VGSGEYSWTGVGSGTDSWARVGSGEYSWAGAGSGTDSWAGVGSGEYCMDWSRLWNRLKG